MWDEFFKVKYFIWIMGLKLMHVGNKYLMDN